MPELPKPPPRKGRFSCAAAGCAAHPSKGDTITRISPLGEPFVGLCAVHFWRSCVLARGSR